jgi:hypothetical protein
VHQGSDVIDSKLVIASLEKHSRGGGDRDDRGVTEAEARAQGPRMTNAATSPTVGSLLEDAYWSSATSPASVAASAAMRWRLLP